MNCLLLTDQSTQHATSCLFLLLWAVAAEPCISISNGSTCNNCWRSACIRHELSLFCVMGPAAHTAAASSCFDQTSCGYGSTLLDCKGAADAAAGMQPTAAPAVPLLHVTHEKPLQKGCGTHIPLKWCLMSCAPSAELLPATRICACALCCKGDCSSCQELSNSGGLAAPARATHILLLLRRGLQLTLQQPSKVLTAQQCLL